MSEMPPKLSKMTGMPQEHILMMKMPQPPKNYQNYENATTFLPLPRFIGHFT